MSVQIKSTPPRLKPSTPRGGSRPSCRNRLLPRRKRILGQQNWPTPKKKTPGGRNLSLDNKWKMTRLISSWPLITCKVWRTAWAKRRVRTAPGDATANPSGPMVPLGVITSPLWMAWPGVEKLMGRKVWTTAWVKRRVRTSFQSVTANSSRLMVSREVMTDRLRMS